MRFLMEISKLFSLTSPDRIRKTQNENVQEKAQSKLFCNVDTVSISKNENVMEKYAYKFDILTSESLKMSKNAELLSSLKAGSLTSLAYDTVAKSYSIIGNLKATIGTYSAEMTSILSSPFLSEEEKKSKLKEIEKKIEKLFDEAIYKISKLRSLTETFKSLAPVFLNLKSSNGLTNEITTMFSTMIENINTKPTDLSEIESPNEMSEKINENKDFFLGKDQDKIINNNLEDILKRKKEIEEKLATPNIQNDEKERLKQELIIYNSMEKTMRSYK